MTEIVGSAQVDLLLNQSRFDQQLAALETLQIKPIPIGLKVGADQLATLRKQIEDALSQVKIGPIPNSGSGGARGGGSAGGGSRGSGGDDAESRFRTQAALTKQRVQEELKAQQEAVAAKVAAEKAAQEAIALEQRRALDRAQAINAQQLADIRRTQSAKIQAATLALRTEQADEVQTQQRIRQINLETSQAIIAEYQRRATVVQGLQQQGLLSERQAAQEQLNIQRTIAAETQKAASLQQQQQKATPIGAPAGLAGIFNKANQFQEATQSAAQLTLGIQAVGQELTRTGNLFRGFAEQAGNAFKQFDTARAKVSTLSDDTEGLTGALDGLRVKLGNQVTTTELLNAGYDTLSSGFSKTADTVSILEAATKGATGGFSDIATVNDALTSTLNAYGLGADKAAKVTDSFIATQNAGKIVLDQYAKQIGRVAPLAAQTGVSLDELNGFIATATIKGVQSEAAFTGIGAALTAVLKPTDDASRFADQLGIQFNLAALKSKGLAGILAELKEKGKDTPDVLQRLFGSVEAVRAIAPSTGEGFGLLQKNIEASKNSAGAATTAFNKVSDSFEGRIKAAFTEVNTALTAIGSGVAIAVGVILKPLIFLVENFNKLPLPIKQAVGVALTFSAGALTLAGALASLAAIVPLLSAGFNVLFARMGVATGATIANTVATGANAAAQTAAAGAINLNVTALGGLILKAGLAAAAFASVNAAIARFQDGGQTFNEAADRINKRLLDIGEQADKAKGKLEGVKAPGTTLPEEPPPTDFIDAAVRKFGEINAASNKLIGLPDDFLAIPSDSIKKLNDARVGIGNLAQASSTANGQVQELVSKFKAGLKPSAEEAAKAQELLTANQEDLTTALQSLDPAKLGTKAYEELKGKLETAQAELTRTKAALDQVAPSSAAAAQGIKGLSQSAAEVKLALDKIDSFGKDKNAQTELTQSEDIAKVKEELAAKKKTKEEAEIEIAGIQAKSSREQVNIVQEQLNQINGLEASGTISAQEAAEKRGNYTKQLADLKTRAADAELAQQDAINAKILKNLELANKQAAAAIKLAETNKTNDARKDVLSGNKSESEANQSINQTQQEATQQTIELKQKELAQVDQLRAQGVIDERTAAEQKLSLNQTLADENLKLTNLQLEKQRQLYEEMQRQNKLIEAQLQLRQSQQALELRRQQVRTDLSKEEVDTRTNALEQKQAEERIKLREAEIKKLNQLKATSGVEKNTFNEQSVSLQQQLTSEQLKLADLQIQRKQQLREVAIKAIQDETAADRRRSQQAISSLEAEKARVVDFAQKRLEIQRSLLEAQGALNQAILDARVQRGQLGVDRADTAVGLLETAKTDKNSQVRRVARDQLQALGFDPNAKEADLLKIKFQREQQLQQLKFQALQREQQLQQKLQEIDLKRQEIAAKQFEIEAKKQVLLQKQAVREAQGELAAAEKLAPGREREQAIAEAKSKLGIAQEGLGTAQENLQLAGESRASLGQIAAETRQANAIKNQAAQDQLANDSFKTNAANQLALVRAGGNAGDLQIGLPPSLGANYGLPPLPGSGGAGGAVAPTATATAPEVTQFLGQKLDQLNANIERLANTPRSLTFQTAKPVDDYASYQNQQAAATQRTVK